MKYRKNQKSPKIREIAESERPRERLMKKGAASLSNAELLAIIISSGTRNESALDLADRVLALENGDLSFFDAYQPEELTAVSGIGPAIACKIAAAIEFGKRVASAPRTRIHMNQPSAVAKYCGDMRAFHKEVFRVAMFSVKGDLISFEDISVGGLASASASPREVFANAIRKGAYSVILVHNHPSGDPSPSQEDISTTKQLSSAGTLLGVKVLDHIIIGDQNYYSFKENNLI